MPHLAPTRALAARMHYEPQSIFNANSSRQFSLTPLLSELVLPLASVFWQGCWRMGMGEWQNGRTSAAEGFWRHHVYGSDTTTTTTSRKQRGPHGVCSHATAVADQTSSSCHSTSTDTRTRLSTIASLFTQSGSYASSAHVAAPQHGMRQLKHMHVEHDAHELHPGDRKAQQLLSNVDLLFVCAMLKGRYASESTATSSPRPPCGMTGIPIPAMNPSRPIGTLHLHSAGTLVAVVRSVSGLPSPAQPCPIFTSLAVVAGRKLRTTKSGLRKSSSARLAQ